MLEATAVAEDAHFWFRGLRRTAGQLIDDARRGRALRLIVDCGAGTGRNLDWLSRLGPTVGVELTPTGLRIGHRFGRRLVQGTVAALPIADGAADLATSFDVLYCLDDDVERRALSEMFRILRPGGFAIINVAALDILHGSHSALTREIRRYTKPRLAARLTAAGFAVERMTFTNMTLFPMALAIRGLERLRGKAGEESEADLQVPAAPVNAVFDLALQAEASLLRVANLPIGTSLMAVARKPR